MIGSYLIRNRQSIRNFGKTKVQVVFQVKNLSLPGRQSIEQADNLLFALILGFFLDDNVFNTDCKGLVIREGFLLAGLGFSSATNFL